MKIKIKYMCFAIIMPLLLINQPLYAATLLFEDTFTGSKDLGWWNADYTVSADNRCFSSVGPVDQHTTYLAPVPTVGSKIIWELTVFANEESGYGFGFGGAQGGMQWAWVGYRGWYQLQIRHNPGNYAFVEYMEKDAVNNTVDYAFFSPAIDFGTVKTYHLKVMQDQAGHDMYINDIWLGRIDDTTNQGGGIGMYDVGYFDDARISKIIEVSDDIETIFLDPFTGSALPDWWNDGDYPGYYHVWNDGTDDRYRRTGDSPGANVNQHTTFIAPQATDVRQIIWEVDLIANPQGGGIVGVPVGGHQHGLQWSWTPSKGMYQCRLKSDVGQIEYIEYDETNQVVDYQTFALPPGAGQWMITELFNLKIVQKTSEQAIYVNESFVGNIFDSTLRGGGVGIVGVGLFDNVKVSRDVINVVGDLDDDEDVDFLDFAIMAENWLTGL